ncbi:MAG TPA: flavodoxin family protein, partial [Alphaproteobacteria bacterium]
SYAYNGRSGDIDLLLWPVHLSLAYVGYTVMAPFVAYGVEAGLRYSEESVIKARLERVEEDLVRRMRSLDTTPNIPFNRMSDWGNDGRVKASAPAYSPFIRHRQCLDLE